MYVKLTLHFPSFLPETTSAQERILISVWDPFHTYNIFLLKKEHANSVCTFSTNAFYCFNVFLFSKEISVSMIVSIFYLLSYPTSNNQAPKKCLIFRTGKKKINILFSVALSRTFARYQKNETFFFPLLSYNYVLVLRIFSCQNIFLAIW